MKQVEKNLKMNVDLYCLLAKRAETLQSNLKMSSAAEDVMDYLTVDFAHLVKNKARALNTGGPDSELPS